LIKYTRTISLREGDILVNIIGISAGRKNKVTESAVKAILEGTNKPYELISLSGKLIRPCEACNGCIKTNRCVLKDDFQPIAEKLYNVDGLVFGAPTYWNHMNSKAQAFWERLCFSGRHNNVFPLAGKTGVIVSVHGTNEEQRYTLDGLKIYFDDARISVAGELLVQGEYACYTCGYGNYCAVGGFIELFPLGTPITKDITPSLTNQSPGICNLPKHKRDLSESARHLGSVFSKVIDITIKQRGNFCN
jgi:multimeric flavodoxin WrbA